MRTGSAREGAVGGSRICIVLPVLNEATHIEPLWDRIREALEPRDYVVCFVDDGSTDGTAEHLQCLASTYPTRAHLIRRRKMMRGSQRGGALYAGLQWALSLPEVQFIVEMDGDLSHRPEELNRGLELVASGACDVAQAPATWRLRRSTCREARSSSGRWPVARSVFCATMRFGCCCLGTSRTIATGSASTRDVQRWPSRRLRSDMAAPSISAKSSRSGYMTASASPNSIRSMWGGTRGCPSFGLSIS
jgi:glycosyltransferase involved in cell wall biosynthesis